MFEDNNNKTIWKEKRWWRRRKTLKGFCFVFNFCFLNYRCAVSDIGLELVVGGACYC